MPARLVTAVLGVAVMVTAATPAAGAPSSPPAAAPSTVLALGACPALYVFAVQGTGESSPDAAPSTDTGMLSLAVRPMMAAASDPGLVDRAYVPYPAGFGGAVGASTVPYAESVATGVVRTESMMRQVHSACPQTRVALLGYSQGAHVVSLVAQQVGAEQGVVAAETVAAVVMMADPTRSPGAPVFPGTDALTPAPAPGTSGRHLALLPAAPFPSVASGGGIGPQRDIAADYGALTGRVANLCVAGDLACDTPTGSAILRAAAGVASQSLLSAGDPIASLVSIGQALAYTSLEAVSTAVEDDVSGASLTEWEVSPSKSISQRLADASDPRTPLEVNAALAAVMRVGVIGLNAVHVLAASVLNPATLAQLGTIGLSQPAAAVAMLGEKFTTAITELIPPTTSDRLVAAAFDVVRREVADNHALLDLTTWVRIWETGMRHDAYSRPIGDGPSPAAWAGAWLAAAAHDAAGTPLPASPSTSNTATAPTTTPAVGLSSTTSTFRHVDLPAPTSSPGPSLGEVVGAPQHIASPPTALPATPDPSVPATVAAPQQPGIHRDTSAPSTSSIPRQPGVSGPTR
ncbi:cutinase family protein [Nocardia neocaledoniensis]|uniref:cutinase family protein n=1 Tax=Nocardia neocaledoniensis TaxID=236511 RepID=UPI002454D0B8|nr:cutinase family protein [Nocardia neocaledoniensis]